MIVRDCTLPLQSDAGRADPSLAFVENLGASDTG